MVLTDIRESLSCATSQKRLTKGHRKEHLKNGRDIVFAYQYGYGCVAASDNEADIIEAAKASILDILQEMHDDGQLLTNLNTGYRDYSVSFPEFDRWVAIEVDDKLIEGKKERFNVSWDKRFLQRVDDHLKSSGKYSDRSVFLAVAVDEKIRQSDNLR